MKKQNDCLEINTFIQSLHQSLKVSAGVLDPQLPCSECRLNILQKTFSTDQPVINESDWKIGAKKLQISITNVKYKHASKSTEIHHFWCLSFFRKKSIPKAHLSPTRPSPCVLSETELCWFVFCRTRGLLYKGSSVDDVSEISVAEDTMCQSTTTSLPKVRTPTTTGGRSYVNLHLWGSGPNSEAFLCAVLPCSGAPRGALGLSRNRCVRLKFTNENTSSSDAHFSVILGQTEDLCPNASGTRVPQHLLLSWRPPNWISTPPVHPSRAPVPAAPRLSRILSNSITVSADFFLHAKVKVFWASTEDNYCMKKRSALTRHKRTCNQSVLKEAPLDAERAHKGSCFTLRLHLFLVQRHSNSS